jgi:hypothetical protein
MDGDRGAKKNGDDGDRDSAVLPEAFLRSLSGLDGVRTDGLLSEIARTVIWLILRAGDRGGVYEAVRNAFGVLWGLRWRTGDRLALTGDVGKISLPDDCHAWK